MAPSATKPPTKATGSSKSTASKVVRAGSATVREKGTFTGVSWKAKRLELDSDNLVIINTSNTKRTRIALHDITHLERTDLADHALVVRAKDKKYNLAFTSDPELYDWQDDIYQRCPLGGYSAPFAFEHKSHIGSGGVVGTFTDPNLIPIYAEIVGTSPSMIHHTSPTTTASVVVTPRSRPVSGVPLKGGVAPGAQNPSHHTHNNHNGKGTATTPAGPAVTSAVLEGSFVVKQKGGLFGWRAKVRWVSLTPQAIVLHSRNSKTSHASKSLPLSTLLRIEPDATTPGACLEIEYTLTAPARTPSSQPLTILSNNALSGPQGIVSGPTEVLYITFSGMGELYEWRDALYLRSSVGWPIGTPTNFKHDIHVGFDAVTGMFSGLPADWQALMNAGTSGRGGKGGVGNVNNNGGGNGASNNNNGNNNGGNNNAAGGGGAGSQAERKAKRASRRQSAMGVATVGVAVAVGGNA